MYIFFLSRPLARVYCVSTVVIPESGIFFHLVSVFFCSPTLHWCQIDCFDLPILIDFGPFGVTNGQLLFGTHTRTANLLIEGANQRRQFESSLNLTHSS